MGVILELLAVYDPKFRDHLNKVKQSEKANKRMQAHYLSHQTQNEFILHVQNECFMLSYNKSKNLDITIILDVKPDSSHKEQTTSIIRYLEKKDGDKT